uniref:CSON004555 protein n=1 Tax=Culicoides sonorensis TaxID=179676 RepID=A0A336L7R1_CULSO
MLLFAALLAINVRIIDSAPITPENITLTFISPTSVKVSWETSPIINQHRPVPEKYDIAYKPANASFRIVLVVAGNSKAVVLGNLVPDTQYTLTVTAIYKSKRYRSRPVTFKTQELTGTNHQQDSSYIMTSHTMGYPMPPAYAEPGGPTVNNIFRDDTHNFSSNSTSNTRELPTIRGVEIGIVLLVLVVWAGAIALFFNRWGKIRMLLPYQPAYKSEQLKVPGTGVCTGQCNGNHSNQQHIHPAPWPEDSVVAIENRCSRARINSAIFVSSEGKGFDSIEFIRRYGSQSVLCRKAKSAENINDEKKVPYQRHIFDVIQQARQHARRQSEIGLLGQYRTVIINIIINN